MVGGALKVLILCAHLENVQARLLARGFSQLGHDVKTAGKLVSGLWMPSFATAEEGFGWRPDLAIMSDHHMRPSSRPDCPYILYAEDWMGFALDVYAIRHETDFDWEFYAYQQDCEGRSRSSHILMAYDPLIHQCGPAWDDRAFDIASMGQGDRGRDSLIAHIEKSYPVVKGYGDLANYVLAYQNSRIALCHSRWGGELGQRIIEQMAMGCLVFTEPRRNYLDYGIVPGRHLIEYETPTDALNKCAYALGHPEESASIAEAGRQLIGPHTWAARAKTILETVGLS